MKVLITIILSVICAFTAAAVEHPVEGIVESLHYHLRITPQRFSKATFELRWNKLDSLSYSFARITTFGQGLDDNNPLQLVIGLHSAAGDSITAVHDFADLHDPQELGLSAVLDVSPTGALLSVGVRSASAEIPVAFDIAARGCIEAVAPSNAQILRDDFSVTYLPDPQLAPFASVDDLCQYLAASTDPAEGLWTYFDRVTASGISAIGGYYTIATVARPDSSDYIIIYIAGAESNAHLWQPLQIKGTLTPATFPGAFDLCWIQPSLAPITFEASATIDGDLLSLAFPHWKTSMRMRRISPAQLTSH